MTKGVRMFNCVSEWLPRLESCRWSRLIEFSKAGPVVLALTPAPPFSASLVDLLALFSLGFHKQSHSMSLTPFSSTADKRTFRRSRNGW